MGDFKEFKKQLIINKLWLIQREKYRNRVEIKEEHITKLLPHRYGLAKKQELCIYHIELIMLTVICTLKVNYLSKTQE